jgi:CPA2 family monovalent cation:H+ antiporter-2
MEHAGLIATVAAALGAAIVFGYLARRLGLSPIIGYLIAGIVIGPHTPGINADPELAAQLAEVGVVLLMFGVGLHFSFRDLLDVRGIAVPGALVQSAVATVLGLGVALAWGWSLGAGLVLGIALSVASTVVLVRGLMDRGLLDTPHGHVAVGWLVVEDILTVLVLVLLPAVSQPLGGVGGMGPDIGLWPSVAMAVGKVIVLGAVVLTVGARVVPWLLVRIARAESRELFTLAVLAIALGIAYGSAALFDVSMALGAFLAGMVVAQSDLSHRAAADAIPLRDAFSVLFFVSVGMLFDPAFLVEEPGLVLATLAVILVAKPVTALLLVLSMGYPVRTALTAAVGLAQIGEFSFILAELGHRKLHLFPMEGYSVVLAGAMISIALNPFLFRGLDRMEGRLRRIPWLQRHLARRARGFSTIPGAGHQGAGLQGHAVLCGSGRVGSVLAQVLRERGWKYVVVEQNRRRVEEMRAEGATVIDGDAANPEVLDHANLKTARMLLVALADPVATSLVSAHAARVNPSLPIIARVDGEEDGKNLRGLGRVEPVVGTLEAAFQMSRHLLEGMGTGTLEAEAALIDLRRAYGYGPVQGQDHFVEIPVAAGSPAVGKRISDLGLGAGTLIVLVRRRGNYVVPSGATALEEGDALLALADGGGLERVSAAVGPPVAEFSDAVVPPPV